MIRTWRVEEGGSIVFITSFVPGDPDQQGELGGGGEVVFITSLVHEEVSRSNGS